MKALTPGKVVLGIGLVSSGVSAGVDNSGSPIAADAAAIPYTSLAGGNFSTADIRKIILAGDNENEYLFTKEDSGSSLTVKRGFFDTPASEIPDASALVEMEFDVHLTIDDTTIDLEKLASTTPMKSNEYGIHDYMFIAEDEAPTIDCTLVEYERKRLNAIFPYGLQKDESDTDFYLDYQGSMSGALASENHVPALIYLDRFGEYDISIFIPKLTIIKPPQLPFSASDYVKMSVQFSMLLQDESASGKKPYYLVRVQKKQS